MLVDKLALSIAAQQDAKRIKPGDHALKLDTVDQKRCQWDLVFAYVVQERVLQILFVRSHFIVALSE